MNRHWGFEQLFSTVLLNCCFLWLLYLVILSFAFWNLPFLFFNFLFIFWMYYYFAFHSVPFCLPDLTVWLFMWTAGAAPYIDLGSVYTSVVSTHEFCSYYFTSQQGHNVWRFTMSFFFIPLHTPVINWTCYCSKRTCSLVSLPQRKM